MARQRRGQTSRFENPRNTDKLSHAVLIFRKPRGRYGLPDRHQARRARSRGPGGTIRNAEMAERRTGRGAAPRRHQSAISPCLAARVTAWVRSPGMANGLRTGRFVISSDRAGRAVARPLETVLGMARANPPFWATGRQFSAGCDATHPGPARCCGDRARRRGEHARFPRETPGKSRPSAAAAPRPGAQWRADRVVAARFPAKRRKIGDETRRSPRNPPRWGKRDGAAPIPARIRAREPRHRRAPPGFRLRSPN